MLSAGKGKAGQDERHLQRQAKAFLACHATQVQFYLTANELDMPGKRCNRLMTPSAAERMLEGKMSNAERQVQRQPERALRVPQLGQKWLWQRAKVE